MKILHWNIHGWADSDGVDNVERVTDFIRDQDPEVVSLVEVDEEWGKPSKLEQVADTLGYHWAFVPAFEYREQGGFGNAILSKSPLRSVHQRHLLPPSLYDGTEPSEPRAVVLVTLVGCPLAIGSTHFPRHDAALRSRAAKRLLKILAECDRPFVVCGDFNQPKEDWLSTTSAALPMGEVPTYPATSPRESIDYFLRSRSISTSATALSSEISDHLPIVVTIDTDSLRD